MSDTQPSVAIFNLYYSDCVEPGYGGYPPDDYYEIVHLSDELWGWMKDNIHHEWKFNEIHGHLAFWNEQDAVLFSLRWL